MVLRYLCLKLGFFNKQTSIPNHFLIIRYQNLYNFERSNVNVLLRLLFKYALIHRGCDIAVHLYMMQYCTSTNMYTIRTVVVIL